MTSDAVASGNVCYRHPDRQSYILCQRCGRTICSQCQTQAPVGVHCPECVREAQGFGAAHQAGDRHDDVAQGCTGRHLHAHRPVRDRVRDRVARAGGSAVPAVLPAAHPGVPVGTRHLDVQSLGRLSAAHPLQHAHALPVRPRARTDARPRALPRALPAERARRIGRRHAAAARRVGHRRIRCDLRSARRVLRDPAATRVLELPRCSSSSRSISGSGSSCPASRGRHTSAVLSWVPWSRSSTCARATAHSDGRRCCSPRASA